MSWNILATWSMSKEGNAVAAEALRNGASLSDAIVKGVMAVEDNPNYHSVGNGGLPDIRGVVTTDAAYMDGNTLAIGAVASMSGIRNPILAARLLSKREYNNVLVGEGAIEFAKKNNLEEDSLLSEESIRRYREEFAKRKELKAYDGHDTVCFIGRQDDKMITCVSTSGLFMKDHGRVGDSPLSGSGFYADAEIGCACATGLGEDIMKTCLSYDIVMRMKNGTPVDVAAKEAVKDASEKLLKRYGQCRGISVIAMDKDGKIGIGTNCDFAFSVTSDTSDTKLYFVKIIDGKMVVEEETV